MQTRFCQTSPVVVNLHRRSQYKPYLEDDNLLGAASLFPCLHESGSTVPLDPVGLQRSAAVIISPTPLATHLHRLSLYTPYACYAPIARDSVLPSWDQLSCLFRGSHNATC